VTYVLIQGRFKLTGICYAVPSTRRGRYRDNARWTRGNVIWQLGHIYPYE